MKNNINPVDFFSAFWFSKLSANQRKTRLELAFIPLKKMARLQISKLESYEKTSKTKDPGFLYFLTTVKNAWDNINFGIEIGKGRFKRFSYYPTRTTLESLLRLEHYCRQQEEGQTDIAIRELLRIAKRFYERERIENGTGEPYKTLYAQIAAHGNYPLIEDADPKDDPFPSIKKLTAETPAYNKDAYLYFSYEALCELSHGKMIATTTATQDELAEHIRSLMGLQSYACNLLRLVDHHIKDIMATEVENAIKSAEEIIKKGMY